MNRIVKNIYVGNWRDSIDEDQLRDNNIRNILCINERSKTSANIKLYKRLGIKHKHIYERDVPSTNLSNHFLTTNGFIFDSVINNQNVLIHCTCGISRASTIAIGYLLFDHYFKQYLAQKEKGDGWLSLQKKSKGSILQKTIEYIRIKRSIINPNEGFRKQLQDYEHMLYSKNNL